MPITGGIKFFEPSMALEVEGASISASSGNPSAQYALDRNPFTFLRSVGSTDLITESWTVTFAENKTIDRLLLIDHNLKEYTVKYDLSGVWTDFTNVVGLDGAMGSIAETAFADDCSYYEFDAVTTGAILISPKKTQIANQEKYISQIVPTSEIGTFVGYPKVPENTFDRNSRNRKTLSGRVSSQKSTETTGIGLDFADYPSDDVYNADMDLVMSLHDREISFLVWLCGGRRGPNYFKYALRGFRLKDVNLLQITSALNLTYTSNIYKSAVNCKVQMDETI